MLKELKKQKKLKVAMIGHKRIPSREGGVEVVVEELSTRMSNNGHVVHVYNRRGSHISGKEHDSEYKDLKFYNGVKLINIPNLKIKGLAALTSSIFATIRAIFGKYDVIHFHAEGPSAMAWLPRIFGIKTVVTIHGLDWQRAKWGKFARIYLKFGEKIAAKYADEVIVLSHNVQNYFKEVYGRNTNIIPNGINKPIIADSNIIKKKWSLEKDEYILYLGRIVPEKGIGYLIEAFLKLETDKKLVIAGGSSDSDDFIMEIKNRAIKDNRVIFTGFVQGKLLQELYSNSYIYVLPSDLEGMPISLLEAMSYGNCCIVSDIPECSEVVEDKALTFKKGNIEDLCKKLEYGCSNPYEIKRYKNKASSYILSKYNWNDVVDKTLKLYENNKRG